MKTKLSVEFLASRRWAIEGDTFQRMASIVQRENLDSLEALEAKSGSRTGNDMIDRNGVTVISVNGVISRYANLFHAICGGTSAEMLAKDFDKALNDPNVNAIILNIDSPGGEVSGTHELGEMIFNARGSKPIHAYISGVGCSAAFWLASACDKIVIDATAIVGSVGVVASMTKKQQEEGQASFEFVSSQSPNKRLDIESKEGQSVIQSEIDDLADVFINRVARNLNINRDTVIQDFGRGGTAVGQKAVDKGMAHELGSLENLIKKLSNTDDNRSSTHGASSNNISNSIFSQSISQETPEQLALSISKKFPSVANILIENHHTPSLLEATQAIEMADQLGFPQLTKKLASLTPQMAEKYIEDANNVKNVIAAAGLEDSSSYLINHIDEPAKLLGMAIHEYQAMHDESGDMNRQILNATQTSATIEPDDVYSRRASSKA
ncbi:MAG: S49 family peptidase [Psychrobium sp.]